MLVCCVEPSESGQCDLRLLLVVKRGPGRPRKDADPAEPAPRWVNLSQLPFSDVGKLLRWPSVELWQRFWDMCKELHPELEPKPPKKDKSRLHLDAQGFFTIHQVLAFREEAGEAKMLVR